MDDIKEFCEKMRERLDASECMSFSGRVESISALFEAIELGPKDCVYLSATAPSYVVRAILACGGVPYFCDIAADSFVIDHKSLAEAVRQTVATEKLYPRVVIAEHFGGLPFSIRAVAEICDRMGLILIEDCGSGFGCLWDGRECGCFGDYSMISLGASSVFGTGGSGCLVMANGDNELHALIVPCDDLGWQSADDIYAEELFQSLETFPESLSRAETALAEITDIMKESDFWLRRGGGRQKSACSATVVIAQSEAQCEAAAACLASAGLSDLFRRLHVHRRACFEHGCRGFKALENASALAPRALVIDIFGAIHSGRLDGLKAQMKFIADNIHA